MDSETWEQVKEAIDEGQELSFDYKGDEWWISRVQADDSFLLTRSSDSDTQYLKRQKTFINTALLMAKPLSTECLNYKNLILLIVFFYCICILTLLLFFIINTKKFHIIMHFDIQ